MKSHSIRLIIISLFMAAAGVIQAQRDPETQRLYDQNLKAMGSLARTILSNPQDVQSIQDLSILLIRVKEFDKARRLMSRAYNIDPRNDKTLFYYGLALEAAGRIQPARDVFGRYTELDGNSPYRPKMKAKFQMLEKQRIGAEVKNSIAQQEANLGVQEILPNSIAVLPLSYLGSDEEYRVLGRGISEMLITDLSQVKQLQMVERMRMQTMVEEMNLAQAGITDESTAPQFGKMLGAEKVLWGRYDVSSKKRLSMDAELVKAAEPGATPVQVSRADALKAVFDLEKRLIFDMLDNMGIELTTEERESILRVPTRNLQAFMAYCRGLESQDAGRFQEAAEHFRQAGELDPDFQEANSRFEESLISDQMSLAPEIITASPEIVEQPFIYEPAAVLPASQVQTEMISNRMQNLSENINSIFVPGQDDRKTVSEPVTSGADVGLGVLPDPPRPPGR